MTEPREKIQHETFVRFREFVKDKNVTIAQKLGVAPATITNWRWRGIAHDKILALASIYGLDAHYIATGERSSSNQINNQFGFIGGSVNQSVNHNYVSPVAANDDWFFIASSDMYPAFAIGDRVRIDTDGQPQAGHYVLVNYNDKQILRKFRPKFDDNGVPYAELIASNDDYPVIDSRHQSFEIIGVAVEYKRKLV